MEILSRTPPTRAIGRIGELCRRSIQIRNDGAVPARATKIAQSLCRDLPTNVPEATSPPVSRDPGAVVNGTVSIATLTICGARNETTPLTKADFFSVGYSPILHAGGQGL